MSDNKFTPGPWDQIEVFNVKGSFFKVWAGETSICNITTRNMESAEFNSKLIAAAPELLDTLENLIIGIGMGWDLEGLIEVADKACAKARGNE